MPTDHKSEFTEVFNGDYWQGSLIQQLLERNNIQTLLKNNLMGGIEAIAVSPGGGAPISIEVPTSCYEEAMELINEFNSPA